MIQVEEFKNMSQPINKVKCINNVAIIPIYGGGDIKHILEIGKEYEIKAIEVGPYSTKVWLKNCDTPFNSVLFDDFVMDQWIDYIWNKLHTSYIQL